MKNLFELLGLPMIGRIHVSSDLERATFWVKAPNHEAYNQARIILRDMVGYQAKLNTPGEREKPLLTRIVMSKRRELAAQGIRALRQPEVPPRIKLLFGK